MLNISAEALIFLSGAIKVSTESLQRDASPFARGADASSNLL
jgi:hypothetical protein